MRYCVFRSLNKSCGLFDISAVINNFIADVRKGGDLLKSFEQSHLVNIYAFFHVQILKGAKSKIFKCKLCV